MANWGPINTHWPESLLDLKPLEPAQSFNALQKPADARLRTAPLRTQALLLCGAVARPLGDAE